MSPYTDLPGQVLLSRIRGFLARKVCKFLPLTSPATLYTVPQARCFNVLSICAILHCHNKCSTGNKGSYRQAEVRFGFQREISTCWVVSRIADPALSSETYVDCRGGNQYVCRYSGTDLRQLRWALPRKTGAATCARLDLAFVVSMVHLQKHLASRPHVSGKGSASVNCYSLLRVLGHLASI